LRPARFSCLKQGNCKSAADGAPRDNEATPANPVQPLAADTGSL
jgi:hypothetical protein